MCMCPSLSHVFKTSKNHQKPTKVGMLRDMDVLRRWTKVEAFKVGPWKQLRYWCQGQPWPEITTIVQLCSSRGMLGIFARDVYPSYWDSYLVVRVVGAHISTLTASRQRAWFMPSAEFNTSARHASAWTIGALTQFISMWASNVFGHKWLGHRNHPKLWSNCCSARAQDGQTTTSGKSFWSKLTSNSFVKHCKTILLITQECVF